MLDKRTLFLERLSKWVNFVRNRPWIQLAVVFLIYVYHLLYMNNFKRFYNIYMDINSFNLYLIQQFFVISSFFMLFFFFYKLYKSKKKYTLLFAILVWFLTVHNFNTYVSVKLFCENYPKSKALLKQGIDTDECRLYKTYQKDGFLAPLLNGYSLYYLFFDLFLFYFLPFFVLIVYIYSSSVLKKNELNRINHSLEIQFLRNQISPHFLFNGLNNIYGLLINNDYEKEKFISNFQNLFNKSFETLLLDFITIKEELAYIESYLSIENLRRKHPILVEKDIADFNNFQIMPFLFFTLIENALKHGFKDISENQKLEITLKSEANMLIFRVKNYYSNSDFHTNSKGIGLVNLKRRLEIFKPNANLVLNPSNTEYEASIYIPIN